MNPENLPTTATPAPVAVQPTVTAAPAVAIQPTVPATAPVAALKPAAPRPGKKQRAPKHAPAL